MVTGSRNWPPDEWPTIYDALDALSERLDREGTHRFTLLHGSAEGPDSWADEWASESWGEVEAKAFPPDYGKHGKRAPHVRNDEMLAQADYVLAFWDGKSRGTKSVIDKAVKRGLDYEVHSPAGVYVELTTEAAPKPLTPEVSDGSSVAAPKRPTPEEET